MIPFEDIPKVLENWPPMCKKDWREFGLKVDPNTIPDEFIQDYKDDIEWIHFTRDEYLKIEFFRKYKDLLDWYWLCRWGINKDAAFYIEFVDYLSVRTLSLLVQDYTNAAGFDDIDGLNIIKYKYIEEVNKRHFKQLAVEGKYDEYYERCNQYPYIHKDHTLYLDEDLDLPPRNYKTIEWLDR